MVITSVIYLFYRTCIDLSLPATRILLQFTSLVIAVDVLHRISSKFLGDFCTPCRFLPALMTNSRVAVSQDQLVFNFR